MKNTNLVILSTLTLSALLAAVGCSPVGSDSNAATAKGSAPVKKIHEVSMRGDATGFFFEPKELTIKQGDLVRWKMVDGAPHNVNFTGREFPTGARVLLENQSKLMGMMLQAPGQTHEIHFTDEFPVGEYNYVCDPHVVLNMTGKLIVTK
jgi:plastocyanin